MNFNQVRAVEGQKDEKGYQISVPMMGTIQNITPPEWNKNGKKFQKVAIGDDTGESHNVKIYLGSNPDMNDSMLTQRFPFRIAPNAFKGKMYYTGFWEAGQSHMQAPQAAQPHAPYQGQQQAPQHAPQGPPQGRQSTNAPQRPVSAESLFIGKQAVVKGVCDALSHSTENFDADLFVATCWKIWNGFVVADTEPLGKAPQPQTFTETAKSYENPDYVGDEPTPPDDSDIPF